MPGSLDNGHLFFPGADFFHLVKSGAGDHKGECLGPGFFLYIFPAESQTITVHRHHSEAAALHIKEGASMDGAALVVADGKESLGNHGPEHRLAQHQRVLLVH